MTLLPDHLAGAVTFSYGDSPAMADELLVLVVSGVKAATCGRLADYNADPASRPEIGRRDVVLDGAGRPAAVIETTELAIVRFQDVDLRFAHDEGEGFVTLDDWRTAHETYFSRNGGYAPDMELLCERFRLVEVLKG